MRTLLLVLGWLCVVGHGVVMGADEQNGHLLVIGGGLRPETRSVFDRLIKLAGGTEKARICVFPTASTIVASAERFAETLARFGVPREQIEIINLSLENAAEQSANPQIVEQLSRCSGVYFTGGDQQRITGALVKSDGSDSPVLRAIRGVLARGGVVAGSSAGAACQSRVMISVAGLPDESLDEGMDALDFGLTQDAARRGLRISRGLGFFTGGIIDQHFHQYRGRLGRLSRALVEQRMRFGFGIDENSAFHVRPDGQVEVLGAGCLTVVDAEHGRCEDSALGCRISGVRVSCLEAGDRFQLRTGKFEIHSGKKPIRPGSESNNGNFLIPDIAGEGAIWHAMVSGLGDNTSRVQVGVTLKHHHGTAHGYRYRFQKTEQTQSFAGYVAGVYSYAVVAANLEIEPIGLTLQSPKLLTPVDCETEAERTKIDAVCFRGLMACDEARRFRPAVAITRAELADALARTAHLEVPRETPPVAVDVAADADLAIVVAKVVGANLMALNREKKFRPDATVSQAEATEIFSRLATLYRGQANPAEKFVIDNPCSRRAAAVAIYQVVGFPW